MSAASSLGHEIAPGAGVVNEHFLDGLCIMAYTRCRGVHMSWFWGWFHSWFYRHVRDRGGGGHHFWTD